MHAVDVIQWVTNITFIAAGLAAFRIWWKQRDSPPARWLFVTFVVIDAIIVAGLVLGEDSDAPQLVVALLLAGIVAFPWCLFRFADALTGERRRQIVLVSTMTAVVVAWGFVLPEFPEQNEPISGVFIPYIIALIVSWAVSTALAAWRLFLAGPGQPGVVRGRVWLLAAGSLLLTLTLLVSSTDIGANNPDQVTIAAMTAAIISLLAAGAFLVGFAPPGPLRSWWRRGDEAELHRATARLMTAASPGVVASIVLPPFGRLVAADAVTLSAGDAVLGTLGHRDAFENAPARRLLERSSPEGGLAMRAVMSETAPLLGHDEFELAERLLLVAGLAVDRAQRARDLAVANAQLELANEELEAFVYSASHDLKNPLIAMLGYVDLLKHHHPYEPDTDPAMYLDRIDRNGWFMSSLIDDLLELSRVGRVEQHAEPVDLRAVLDESREDVSVEYPELRVTVASPLPTVMMARTRARQLLTNILANAGRHAGHTAEVTISAEATTDGMRVFFEDDGPGIEPGQEDRIFRVFERLDNDRTQGNGVGLAICRRIAQSIGGDMVAEPNDGGARFVVTIASTHLVTERAGAAAARNGDQRATTASEQPTLAAQAGSST